MPTSFKPAPISIKIIFCKLLTDFHSDGDEDSIEWFWEGTGECQAIFKIINTRFVELLIFEIALIRTWFNFGQETLHQPPLSCEWVMADNGHCMLKTNVMFITKCWLAYWMIALFPVLWVEVWWCWNYPPPVLFHQFLCRIDVGCASGSLPVVQWQKLLSMVCLWCQCSKNYAFREDVYSGCLWHSASGLVSGVDRVRGG